MKQEIIEPERILHRILSLRDQKVMVNRNLDRFPKDFACQLTTEEFASLKSQIVISSWGGVRTRPYAFTEQGVTMLISCAGNVTTLRGPEDFGAE